MGNTKELKWLTLAYENGIRTSEAKLCSPWGFAHIRRYENMRTSDYLAYVGVVVNGASVTDCNFGGDLEGAIRFTQHPFRTIDPGDYWYGSEIGKRSDLFARVEA
jgi:hypothetical protein